MAVYVLYYGYIL